MLDTAGALTQHMATHIVAMNIFAPACAAAWVFSRRDEFTVPGGSLLWATVLQTALLWGWHAPGVFAAAFDNPVLMATMHVSLFGAALWFWLAVIDAGRRADWSPLAALLITGKLFCLLGVLLTFAPRAVYWQLALLPSCFANGGLVPNALADQQLAGLIMLVACPVAYVGAATLITQRWLSALGAARGWSPDRGQT